MMQRDLEKHIRHMRDIDYVEDKREIKGNKAKEEKENQEEQLMESVRKKFILNRLMIN